MAATMLLSGGARAATITLGPEADAWVDAAAPTVNHGNDTTLEIGDAPARRAYLRFAGTVPFGAVVTRTTLRLFSGSATSTPYQLRLASTSQWDEQALTFDNAPTFTGPVSGETASLAAGHNNVSVPLLTPGVPITYVLTRASPDTATFTSREAANPPQLVVEYQSPDSSVSSVCAAAGCVESRPGPTTMSWGVLVADFNNDGRDDQLVMRHSGGEDQIQLQQPDGTFRPYEKPIPGGQQLGHFPGGDRHGCAAGDVNADGRTDLYCMLGGDGGEGVKSNELWIQQPDGTFAANQAAAWGVDDPFGRGRRPLLLDFDHIGSASDLYITNHGPRADRQRTENALYLNNGTPAGRFTEKTVSATGSHGGVCVTSGSWDNDSFQDLVVCGDQLHLFHNDADPGGGRVTTQRDFLTGTPVAFPEDAKLADVDRDGWPDLVVVTKTQLQVRLNLGAAATPTLRFPLSFSARLVDGKSVSVGDLTTDGAPDIYVVQGSEPGPEGPHNAPDRLFAGPSWAEVGIPSVDTGTGDDSEFISIAGRKAVIVTNGRDFSRGPVQTITFSPASAEPPPQPPPAPAPAPAPVPPVTTTQTLPPLPDPARVILLPRPRRCIARRALRLRIRSSAIALHSAVVRVNGKRVRTLSRAELGGPVRLRRVPARRFSLEVIVQTADGRALRRSRTYRPCRGR